MMFPCLGIFLAFIGVLTYQITRSDHAQQDVIDSFWDREATSNTVSRKDLSSLKYISIPLDRFPIGIHDTAEINAIEDTLSELSCKKILNLTGKTNTDLKLEFGTANLPFLSECDDAFSELVVLLNHYANELINVSDTAGATAVLEFAISVGSDISDSYTNLAKLYNASGHSEKISQLILLTERLDDVHKTSLQNKLKIYA